MRFLIRLLFLTAICAVCEANDWVRVGDEAYRHGDLAKAVEAYRSARHADPKNYEANWKLARSLNDQGLLMKRSPQQKECFLEALAFAQEATRLNPKDSKAVVYVAISEGKVALFEGGKKKIELGKDVKAQAEKAIELNPREDLAYHVLGVWNREMATLNPFLKTFAQWFYGKFPPASLDASVMNFKKAIGLNEMAVAHHAELGLTYLEIRKWAEARD